MAASPCRRPQALAPQHRTVRSLGSSFRALVVGDTGALRVAFVRALQASVACECVVGPSRASQPGFDLRDAASIVRTRKEPAQRAGRGTLAQAFAINTTGPLLLQPLQPRQAHLEPGRALYTTLSARVRSIGDSRAGGWYSDRAPTAALNVLLHTASIELQRRRPE